MTRVSNRLIPNWPTRCTLAKSCVYRDQAGACDEPRINKGNGDSACHRMNNRDLLVHLAEAEAVKIDIK